MTKENAKIAVFGVGGVGGAIAAMMMKTYGDQVSLIARGKRKEHLEKNGLTIRGDFTGEFTVQPARVTDNPAELGIQDIVLVCVKNDALPKAAEQILPIVGEETVVLPVMNGVTGYRELRELLPRGIVMPSVIFIVSMAKEDYSIVQQGKFFQVTSGNYPGDEVHRGIAEETCRILGDTGISWRFSESVLTDIWTKFILNCAYNVVTARWACNVGQIKADPDKLADCRKLMEECAAVGRAQGVEIPENVVDKMMKRIDKSGDSDTSSLSRDFEIKKKGEMEVFSGAVVRMAADCGIGVPVTEAYYEGLQEIAAGF
ncbi:MAG: 2-dehydropantoate 2-reductase [Clostridium sp.]|nr:2-dehydropantoate 2-reductase [Clostridium sp.]MBO6149584.1 2-dehydropantoate 2-reductase [Clostridium sp.]